MSPEIAPIDNGSWLRLVSTALTWFSTRLVMESASSRRPASFTPARNSAACVGSNPSATASFSDWAARLIVLEVGSLSLSSESSASCAALGDGA